jgi:hypothetical protein
VALVPAGVCGQTPRLEMDVSAAKIEYDTLDALNAPSLSVLTEWQRPSLFGRVTANVTAFENAGWSVQGRAVLSAWLSPLGRRSPLRLELGGLAGGSRHSRGFDTSLGQIDGRMHLLGRRSGAWLGTSLDVSKNSLDSASVGAIAPNAGAWVQGRSVRGMVSYQHTSVSGDTYPEANLVATLTQGPLDLTVYGGVRRWPTALNGSRDERWAGATAVYWLTSKAALTASGGRYSSDVLQGLPGGRFLAVGVRFTARRVRAIPINAAAPIVYTLEEATTGSIGFDVDGATRVEIAGDWTDWQRVTLQRDGSGRWILPRGLEPGAYRFNLLVDGERWTVPEGVPRVDDGFGGVVGLLIVSGRSSGM